MFGGIINVQLFNWVESDLILDYCISLTYFVSICRAILECLSLDTFDLFAIILKKREKCFPDCI